MTDKIRGLETVRLLCTLPAFSACCILVGPFLRDQFTPATSDCTVAQERISVWAHWNFFFSEQKCADFQIQRAGEGFQVAGSPDPEAKGRVCLALEVTLQRYVKSNCTRSSTVFCHRRTAESTVLMYQRYVKSNCTRSSTVLMYR